MEIRSEKEHSQQRIQELEKQNQLMQQHLHSLMEEKQKQKKELDFQHTHVKELQQSLGQWKRKAKGQSPQYEFIRESHDGANHYKEFALKDIPGDLSYREVLRHVKRHVLPYHYPSAYHGLYMSKRYGGWVVKLSVFAPYDMSYTAKKNQITERKKLNQLHWDLMADIRQWEEEIANAAVKAEKKDHDKIEHLAGLLHEVFNQIQQTRFD